MRAETQEILDRLKAHADLAAKDLLPEGRRVGGEWHCTGTKSPLGYAVSVVLHGSKKGLVGFWGGAGREGGSLLRLATEIYGGDWKEAMDWARLFLGMRAYDPKATPQRIERQKPQPKPEAEDRRMARRIALAREIWSRGHAVEGTPAERYLLNRGLTKCDWPASLRFVPDLEWEPGAEFDGGRKVVAGPRHPALIACLQAADRTKTGIWRIYITRDGQKAALPAVKMGMGQAKGSAARLGPVGEELDIGEGLETSLALLQLNREAGVPRSVWSTLSTSGMKSLVLPPDVRRLFIYPDGDIRRRNKRSGRLMPEAGLSAGEALAARMRDESRQAKIMPTLVHGDYLDGV